MGMDMNIGLVIGAVVSGAYFGDKMSPISDTTVMSSALAGVPVMKHIKHMLWTVVPGYAVTFLLFLFLGIQNANATIDYGTVNGTMAAMAANFKLGFVTLLPMILFKNKKAKTHSALHFFTISFILITIHIQQQYQHFLLSSLVHLQYISFLIHF